MRFEFLHGLNAAAESRWKRSARTDHNECSKHILCVGNFQILGFHLSLSKGNFLNHGISPKWGWWFSHYSLLAKLKRREQKPFCHQRLECYFPHLVQLLQKFSAWVCRLFSLFLPLYPTPYLCLTVFLGVMDLAKHLLFCINNGSVTLANPFHLTSNDLFYIRGKENKKYEPLTDLTQLIQAITTLECTS